MSSHRDTDPFTPILSLWSSYAPDLIAALVTPYNQYGGIDTDGVGQLVEHAIQGGVTGLLVNSYYGEGANLSRGERLFVIEAALEAANGQVPVAACTGATSTEETLALTWDAEKAGLAAAFVQPPAYYRLSQGALQQHYHAIAQRVKIPLVVDNAPIPGGNKLTPERLGRLATLDGVVAVVQADPGSQQLQRVLNLPNCLRPILSGYDPHGEQALIQGAAGLVSALAGILPSLFTRLTTAMATGDRERADRTWQQIAPILPLLDQRRPAIAACKALLQELGLPGGHPRAPLAPPGRTALRAVRSYCATLQAAGV